MRIISTISVGILSMAMIAGCGNTVAKSVSGNEAANASKEFLLPEIPRLLSSPEQRAEYMLNHYWDNFDFADTSMLSDTAFVEQAFANYLSVFPVVEDTQKRSAAVDSLTLRGSVSPEAFTRLCSITEKYLYEINSPMHDDELFILFARSQSRSQYISEYYKIRYDHLCSELKKNRIGTKAADFGFIDGMGTKRRLYSESMKSLNIIMFYDVDCEHCKACIEDMRSSPEINDAIASGNLSVLAINIEDDKAKWLESLGRMPDNWTIGMSTSVIDDLYLLRASPSIYLIDKDKKVLVKDVDSSILKKELTRYL